MPHLMLTFEATREMEGVEIGFGQIEQRPSGREQIKFKMIDTDNGKIVELEADVNNIRQAERQPTPPEIDLASRSLGKGVGEKVSKVEYDRVVTERDSYRQKSVNAEQIIRDKDSAIANATKEITSYRKSADALRKQQLPQDDKNLVAAALDNYIEYLLATQQYSSYEDAKRIYKLMTGRPYVDDGSEEDDQEDDSRCHGGMGHPPPDGEGNIDRGSGDLEGLAQEFLDFYTLSDEFWQRAYDDAFRQMMYGGGWIEKKSLIGGFKRLSDVQEDEKNKIENFNFQLKKDIKVEFQTEKLYVSPEFFKQIMGLYEDGGQKYISEGDSSNMVEKIQAKKQRSHFVPPNKRRGMQKMDPRKTR